MAARLTRAFFARDPLEVAPDLLGKLLVARGRSGRIVEVEAYRSDDDPGSHGYRGVTPRTEVMFGPPGHLYVYFTYGMHWCANVVCSPKGTCGAVLIRALEPVLGMADMVNARPAAKRERDLCNGPAKLCQALAITGADDGMDVTLTGSGIGLRDDGREKGFETAVSTRIGLGEGKGRDLPWRFYLAGSPHVSGRRSPVIG